MTVPALSRRLLLTAAALLAAAPLLAAQRTADFNGDGRADLVIAAPGESIHGASGAGAVHVLYGTATGLSTAASQFWHQNTRGIADTAEAGDRFGEAWVSGDFNGDGFSDLAVGMPSEDVGFAIDVIDAGVVHILHGSPAGLSAAGSQYLHLNIPGVEGVNRAGQRFGFPLVVGDFNGDGRDELVVSALGEPVVSQERAGVVHVFSGSASGLTVSGDQRWHQNSPGIPFAAETGDEFGATLLVGDFGNGSQDDLVIAAPGEDLGTATDAGAVHVLYGGAAGLSTAGALAFDQNTSGIATTPGTDERFGERMISGDFNGDGVRDLVLGVPNEDPEGIADAGAVFVISGSASGLDLATQQFWHMNAGNLRGNARPGARFGFALAAADFSLDGNDELVIGSPFYDGGDNFTGSLVPDKGVVSLLRGTASGLSTRRQQIWIEGLNGGGPSEVGDRFGYVLSTGDFEGNGTPDLVVGQPFDDDGSLPPDSGAVQVTYGGIGGGDLPLGSMQEWHLDKSDVAGTTRPFDRLGLLLQVGDYNGDGADDLALPMPFHKQGTATEAGAVSVLYGTPNRLSATGSQYWTQSVSGVADIPEPGDLFGWLPLPPP